MRRLLGTVARSVLVLVDVAPSSAQNPDRDACSQTRNHPAIRPSRGGGVLVAAGRMRRPAS